MANSPTPEPIVMAYPFKNLDTELQVFNQSFHCHSSVLKKHSEYFARSFDPKFKTRKDFPQGEESKYKWITHVDKKEANGRPHKQLIGWSLEWERSVTEEEKERKFVGDELKNIIAFDILLRSMYSEPLTESCVDFLELAIVLAEFFIAIPCLSRAVESLISTEGFEVEIPESCLEKLGIVVEEGQ
ncbi:hypothetical protein GLAREA_08554 [Glarea lozoyensis ATCC 20868]|uniref:BTB domain-containing protein n=1 Tax=Glarea lozoyensis (strain ATCC 20868 / MF5171) TaxID=1116229 RepID=S3CXZ2_GLAL2|nr:uncharacterized protein GLAREA_08554 [Glarea lozoyensis ATCC 20868]EPE24701.1 hypothetical protein GLAREA_08554 [Glarea lozoyensis ATCC 20868]